MPPEERVKFFVYIIESPNPSDLYHKRYEGDMLQKALSLDSIYSSHRIAANKVAFHTALLNGLNEEISRHRGLIPVIHISAHGSSEGIALTSEEIISWDSLKEALLPINKALNNNLLLCMSSCEGFSACRMAMAEDDISPFFGVVGNSGKPTWSDTAIAYATFYHLIVKGCYLRDAVKAMCESSNDDKFQLITSVEAKKVYLDVIKEQNANNLKRELEQEIRNNPPSAEAKDLENKS